MNIVNLWWCCQPFTSTLNEEKLKHEKRYESDYWSNKLGKLEVGTLIALPGFARNREQGRRLPHLTRHMAGGVRSKLTDFTPIFIEIADEVAEKIFDTLHTGQDIR